MTRDKLLLWCNLGIQFSLMAMLLIVPLVFFTYTHDVFETNKITAFRILTLLAFAAFLTRWLLLKQEQHRPSMDENRSGHVAQGNRLRPSQLWWPLVAIGVSSLLSTLSTNNTLASVFGVYEDFEGIVTIANYIMLWIVVYQSVRNLDDIRKYLVTIVIAGMAAAGYGVAQNFGFDFVMWNPNTYTASRLFGSLGNPNFLAAYILMSLPIAVMFFLTARRRGWKTVMLVATLLMVLAIFFTKSRGALYGLLAEGALLSGYLAWNHLKGGGLVRRNRNALIALACLAGLTLFSGQVRSAIVETVTRTAATLNAKHITMTPRLYIWRSALQMMRDHPVLGSGLDTFQITFPKYRLVEYWQLEWNGTPEKAHNFFLQIGATTGLLGLAAWLWMIVGFFVVVIRQWRTMSPLRQHLSVGILLAQTGFLVQNQFNFTVVAYGSLFWFLLALGPTLNREEEAAPAAAGAKPEPFSLNQVPLGRWVGYLAAMVLVMTGLTLSMRLWVADVYFKRGMIYLSGGYSQNALAEFGRAVDLDPYREIYWVKYGIAFEEAAKGAADKAPLLKRAAEIHQRTIGMNPLNGYDYNNLGRVYKYWGDFVDRAKLADAEAACKKATEMGPYNVYFALDLASVYLSLQQPEKAEAISKRLVDLFPDFAIPYSYLGYVALLRGDMQAAHKHLGEAVGKNWRGDVNTQASTNSNLGIVRARRNEWEGAIQAFQKALELRPQYLEARLNLALIFEQQGRKREAAAEYRYVLSSAPQFPRAEELRQKIAILEGG